MAPGRAWSEEDGVAPPTVAEEEDAAPAGPRPSATARAGSAGVGSLPPAACSSPPKPPRHRKWQRGPRGGRNRHGQRAARAPTSLEVFALATSPAPLPPHAPTRTPVSGEVSGRTRPTTARPRSSTRPMPGHSLASTGPGRPPRLWHPTPPQHRRRPMSLRPLYPMDHTRAAPFRRPIGTHGGPSPHRRGRVAPINLTRLTPSLGRGRGRASTGGPRRTTGVGACGRRRPGPAAKGTLGHPPPTRRTRPTPSRGSGRMRAPTGGLRMAAGTGACGRGRPGPSPMGPLDTPHRYPWAERNRRVGRAPPSPPGRSGQESTRCATTITARARGVVPPALSSSMSLLGPIH